MKYSFKNWLDESDKRICEREDCSFEIIQLEEKRGRKKDEKEWRKFMGIRGHQQKK